MAAIVIQAGQVIFKAGDPMDSLKLLTNGTVTMTYPGDEFELSAGDVPGICEAGSEVHFLTCTAKTDVTLFSYPYPGISALEPLFKSNPDVSRLFVRSMMKQNALLLRAIASEEIKCSDDYRQLEDDLEHYKEICANYMQAPDEIPGLSNITSYIPDEEPDMWLANYYDGLNRFYATDAGKLLTRDPQITSGMIRKGCLDARKSVELLEQSFHYREGLASLYINTETADLLTSIDSLIQLLDGGSEDRTKLTDIVTKRLEQIGSILDLSNPAYAMKIDLLKTDLSEEAREKGAGTTTDVETLKAIKGSMDIILNFCEDPELIASFKEHLAAYKATPDKSSLDEEPMKIRRTLTKDFYALYEKIFFKTVNTRIKDIPVHIKMFLYFGYVDEMLAGQDNAVLMYKLASEMKDQSEVGLYTALDWLRAIYYGKKMPSRDEFDTDYFDNLKKKKASHDITEEQFKKLSVDAHAKTKFEMDTLFTQGNKVTFGRISTYCPVFTGESLLKNLDTSLVTLGSLNKSLNQIRKIDFSAYYRELLDKENYEVMGKELIHLEYLPDIILMPNAGTRGMLWQDIEGRYRNSHSRMVLSIFHMEDLFTTLTRLTGDFRWELCKTMQGAAWNNVSEPSLTSEYYDYVQFYKKNHDLTTDAKEKIRTSLQRSKNSFKEMFIRDYITWIMFEATGSPRLNKVSREILFKYCPFSAEILTIAGKNPMYSQLIDRMKLHAGQRLHTLETILKKQQTSGGPIPETLTNEIEYIKRFM